jgi:hypothetical protein
VSTADGMPVLAWTSLRGTSLLNPIVSYRTAGRPFDTWCCEEMSRNTLSGLTDVEGVADSDGGDEGQGLSETGVRQRGRGYGGEIDIYRFYCLF